jgi:hypothetical protein
MPMEPAPIMRTRGAEGWEDIVGGLAGVVGVVLVWSLGFGSRMDSRSGQGGEDECFGVDV